MFGGIMKSVYIHIPFCDKICSYCDFCKVYYNSDLVREYLYSLSNEISSLYDGDIIETIYIGGGTPSVLSHGELNILFSIISKFNLASDYEFTFECNIESIDNDKLLFLFNHGVNRLSIGVQTFNDKFLKFLNRSHTSLDVINKINMAKKVGFSNINVDLMYAFPNESLSDVCFDIDCVLKLGVSHISTYSLMIEPHTKLYIDNVANISSDIDRDMYGFTTFFIK